MPGQLESVPAGRHFLTMMLLECELTALSDAVALAASEVLSNAVLHARTSIEVVFDLGEQLIVSVHDGTPPWTSTGPGVSHLALPASDSETGRGLALVAAVTDTWGVRPKLSGKAVWFSLALPGLDPS